MLRRAVHTAAAGASSEGEFFARLDAAGLLVRRRFSQRDPGRVTGYAVARPGHVNGQGASAWFGGGKLAADTSPCPSSVSGGSPQAQHQRRTRVPVRG